MKHPIRTCAGLIAVLVLMTPAVAGEPARTHNVTLDDYFTLAFITEQAISPDGRLVAYAEGRWQASTNDRKADLWLANAETGEATRLTFDRAGYNSLQWAPDSTQLYFAAARKREGATGPPYDGKTQVWRLPVGGGEPLAVTQVPGGIDRFGITGNGRSLFYVTSRQEAGGPWTALAPAIRQCALRPRPGRCHRGPRTGPADLARRRWPA